jgi:uncharacterized protein YjbI with pentapeptide repeats
MSWFQGCQLDQATFSRSNLFATFFIESSLVSADMSYTAMESTIFFGSGLADANLAGAEIKGSQFLTTGLNASQLASTASYERGDLSGCVFSSESLNDIDLCGKTLSNSSFQNSDLSGASLIGANLQGSCFVGSNLTGAFIGGANVSRADFRGVTGFSELDFDTMPVSNLDQAILSDGTVDHLLITDGTRQWFAGSAIPIAVTESLNIASGATLCLAGGSKIIVSSDAVADIGGTLELQMSFYSPKDNVGATFDLFDWAYPLPIYNRFDKVTFSTTLPEGLSWDISKLYTTGEVTLVPEPLSLAMLTLGVAAMLRRRRSA